MKKFLLCIITLLISCLTACGYMDSAPGKNVSGELSTDYSAFLETLYEDSTSEQALSYCFKDLDNNGIDELIIKEESTAITVYTLTDTVTELGAYDFKTDTLRLLYSDKPFCTGIFYYYVAGGADHYGCLTIQDDSLILEDLWEERYAYAEEDDPDRIVNHSSDRQLIKESKISYNENKDLEFSSLTNPFLQEQPGQDEPTAEVKQETSSEQSRDWECHMIQTIPITQELLIGEWKLDLQYYFDYTGENQHGTSITYGGGAEFKENGDFSYWVTTATDGKGIYELHDRYIHIEIQESDSGRSLENINFGAVLVDGELRLMMEDRGSLYFWAKASQPDVSTLAVLSTRSEECHTLQTISITKEDFVGEWILDSEYTMDYTGRDMREIYGDSYRGGGAEFKENGDFDFWISTNADGSGSFELPYSSNRFVRVEITGSNTGRALQRIDLWATLVDGELRLMMNDAGKLIFWKKVS